jgi:hypothetical protein
MEGGEKKMKDNIKVMNKKPLWMIWDCVTGSVDGFYFDKDIAENVFNMLKEEGCTSIMLCEIKKRPRGATLPDHLFHNKNDVGFYGRIKYTTNHNS